MFRSAGAGESAKAGNGFVRLVNAAAPAAAPKPDAEAVQLLRDATRRGLPGARTSPALRRTQCCCTGGKEARGTITVDREYKITYALGDPNTEKALEGSFGSLIMHRRGGNPEYAAQLAGQRSPHRWPRDQPER